jgi:hypothetical protein
MAMGKNIKHETQKRFSKPHKNLMEFFVGFTEGFSLVSLADNEWQTCFGCINGSYCCPVDCRLAGVVVIAFHSHMALG